MKRVVFPLLLLGVLATTSTSRAYAEPLAYPWDAFNRDQRWAALAGEVVQESLNWHTLSTLRWTDGSGEVVGRPSMLIGDVGLVVFDPYIWTSYNSGFPYGGNDGAVWQGRGATTGLSGGASLEYHGLSVTVLPELWFAQNTGFDTLPAAAGTSGYTYFTPGIDTPQRYGDDPVFRATPGQSEIRYSWRSLTAGFGNQAIWLGPTSRNSVLLSNNAGGFPRFDIGLVKTPTRLGNFEVFAWWGRLQESDYYDEDSENDERLFSGVSLSWQALGDRGPTIGLNRVVIQDWNDPTLYDLVIPFNPSPVDSTYGSDGRDQRFSATISWRLPDYGFEVYGEWARNDFSGLRQLFLTPEHADGFSLGFRQRFATLPTGRFWSIELEILELMQSRNYEINELGRSTGGFYTHGQLPQGHTHLGQILGARAGTGADSQYLRVARHADQATLGWILERRSINKDFIYGASDRELGDQERLQIEIVTGPDAEFHLNPLVLEIQILWVHRLNFNYIERGDRNSVYGMIGARYQLK